MKIFELQYVGPVLRILFIYFGFGYIYQMLHKPKEGEYTDRKPSQFFLWIIGIHFAIYGLAIQRYEINANRLNNTFNSYVELLGNNIESASLQGFFNLQRIEIPIEAKIADPCSVYESFFVDKPYQYVVDNVSSIGTHYLNNYNSKEIRLRNLIVESLKFKQPDEFQRIYFDNVEAKKISVLNKSSSGLSLNLTNAKVNSIDYNSVSSAFLNSKNSSIHSISAYRSKLLLKPVSPNVFNVSYGISHGDVRTEYLQTRQNVFYSSKISTNRITTELNSIFIHCTLNYNKKFKANNKLEEPIYYKCLVNGDSVGWNNEKGLNRVINQLKRVEPFKTELKGYLSVLTSDSFLANPNELKQ